jgi:hypothetical protein
MISKGCVISDICKSSFPLNRVIWWTDRPVYKSSCWDKLEINFGMQVEYIKVHSCTEEPAHLADITSATPGPLNTRKVDIESEDSKNGTEVKRLEMFKLLRIISKSAFIRQGSATFETNSVNTFSNATNMPPPTKFGRKHSVTVSPNCAQTKSDFIQMG